MRPGRCLLFLANALAILLAGGGLLVVLGLSAARTGQLAGHARRNAFLAISVAIIVVAVPLATTGTRMALDFEGAAGGDERRSLLGRGAGLIAATVIVDGDQVHVTVTGPAVKPSVAALQAALSLGPRAERRRPARDDPIVDPGRRTVIALVR